MTATFDPALADGVSQVRQYIGDTDTANAEVQDETISAYLVSFSAIRVAARLAMDLAAKYARFADTTVDDQLTRFKHIYDNYVALAKRLTAEADAADAASNVGNGFSAVFVGGLTDCRGPLDNCPLEDYDCPEC